MHQSGMLAARFGAHVPVTGAASRRTYQYLEVRQELVCSGRFSDDTDFVFEGSVYRHFEVRWSEERDGRVWDSDCQSFMHGQSWTFPVHRGMSSTGMPGSEKHLRYCGRGLPGPPMTSIFNVEELMPEAFHAVIKTAELLSDLGDAIGYSLEEPIDLTEALRVEHGWYKPQSGYDGATAAVWAKNVHIWGKHLKGHHQQLEYVKAVIRR
jgi:hypothetical protein